MRLEKRFLFVFDKSNMYRKGCNLHINKHSPTITRILLISRIFKQYLKEQINAINTHNTNDFHLPHLVEYEKQTNKEHITDTHKSLKNTTTNNKKHTFQNGMQFCVEKCSRPSHHYRNIHLTTIHSTQINLSLKNT